MSLVRDLAQQWKISFTSLSAAEQRKLIRLMFAKFFAGLLDPIAVGILGLAMSLLVAGFGETPSWISSLFLQVGISVDSDLKSRMGWLIIFGFLVVALFILKSLASVAVLRKLTKFLSVVESDRATTLLQDVKAFNFIINKKFSFDQLSHALTVGAAATYQTTLYAFTSLISELANISIVILLLFVVDPLTAATSAIFFSVLAILIQRVIGPRLLRISRDQSEAQVRAHTAIRDTIFTYRDTVLNGNSDYFVKIFRGFRKQSASSLSNIMLLSSIPRHIFEVALIVGGFTIAILSFLTQSIPMASTTVVVFLAAASRLTPSLVVISTNIGTIRHSAGDVDLFSAIKLSVG